MIYELKVISFNTLLEEMKSAIDVVVADGIYVMKMENGSIFLRKVENGTITL